MPAVLFDDADLPHHLERPRIGRGNGVGVIVEEGKSLVCAEERENHGSAAAARHVGFDNEPDIGVIRLFV